MTLYLVRHGSAGDRGHWHGPDSERPLDARGREQAEWLAALLECVPITAILSSRYTRCGQTVGVLAARRGLTVVDEPGLAEGASRQSARLVISRLANTPAVLCSHGDVIPELLATLRSEGTAIVGKPANAKASVWRLDVTDGTVTRAVYLPPGV
jgi:broad specificity phosphatase PhoE